jgi:hypothetical protein
MKKLFIFITLFLLMVSFSLALSVEDITGALVSFNAKPEINLDTPSNNHVYSTDSILISWTYTDEDPQEAYLIEISQDYQFSSPMYIGGTDKTNSKNIKVRQGEGTYWVRVKVKDAYTWSKSSDVRSFVIDLSPKKCSDNTKFWECSNDIPNYCDQGILKEDCSLCGCPLNSICQPSGRCFKLTCSDRTGYSECSRNQPNYCQAGNLVELCSLCGCPSGQSCQVDGSCSSAVFVTPPPIEAKSLSLLERIAIFFKGLFGQ